MEIAIIHHLDPIHHLCSRASKVKMEDESVHTAASSSIMLPLPAICIASSKGLSTNGLAQSPTAPANAFQADNNSSIPVAAPSPVFLFPVMAALSLPQ
eukprot:3278362-Ditylum_brightwellii.AAC.1